MKKNVFGGLVIVVLCLFCGGYFGYKGYVKVTYDIKRIEAIDGYKQFFENVAVANTITVLGSNQLGDTIQIGDLSIRNDFGDFVKLESSDVFTEAYIYTLYDDDGGIEARITIGSMVQNIDLLREDMNVLGNSSLETNGSKEERVQFLEEENITNDLELIDFLVQTKEEKLSIFTPAQRIKNIYDIHALSAIFLASYVGFSYIDGNVQGYLVQVGDNGYECNLYQGSNRYVITFGGSLFTKNYIEELLNTITID